jgi:hypothetical protein
VKSAARSCFYQQLREGCVCKAMFALMVPQVKEKMTTLQGIATLDKEGKMKNSETNRKNYRNELRTHLASSSIGQ